MRLPEWIKTNTPAARLETKHLLRRHKRATVCEEARCPNRGECFSKPTAAFMILGSSCTRNCGFCSVDSRAPGPVDECEPEQVADAAAEMGLRYVVITSVTRDDLDDGGASQFAKTITAVRRRLPDARIEVLVPDFRGREESVRTVISAGPDVFNHNIETVERLYPLVRPQAEYERSLVLLNHAKTVGQSMLIKSGFMLGLGESPEEVSMLMADLLDHGCDLLTIGQYLQPTKKNLPVVKYFPPEAFAEMRDAAYAMGFRNVASGPLVRSSMHAEDMFGALQGDG